MTALGRRTQLVLNRELVKEILEAIGLLEENPKKNGHLVVQSCWRELTIQLWDEVQSVEKRLEKAYAAGLPGIVVTQEEYDLLDKILACHEAVCQETAAQTGQTIGRVGTMVGVVAGVVALLSYFGK